MAGRSNNAKPRLACEIVADRVIAGRCDEQRRVVELCSERGLSEGSVVPGLTGANVAQREALQQAVADAMSVVAGRSRDVIVVIPDAAVRVLLLDFETLPEKAQEAEAVVRFRLKKSLPFDVDKAAVSFHAQLADGGVKVVAAVALSSVIEEYESVFRDCGYAPGVVLPSMIAALGTVDADRPTLVLKMDLGTTSVAIVDGDKVQLFRTVENTKRELGDPEQLAEEVYPSMVFFQDTYGVKVERILVAGVPSIQHLAPALAEQTGATVDELVSSSQVGGSLSGNTPACMLAGLVGALIS